MDSQQNYFACGVLFVETKLLIVMIGRACGGRRSLDHTHVAGIVYCPCTVVLININRVAREVATEKVGQCESVCDASERQQQASGRSSQVYLRWELVLRVHTIVHVCVCEGLQT